MVGEIWQKAKQFIGLEGEESNTVQAEVEERDGGVIRMKSFRKSTSPADEDSDFEVAVYQPRVYEDSLSISTHLRQGNPVIVNIRSLEPNDGTRLIDFVCGAAYAIDGHMMRIGDSIFLFTPKNIAIRDVEERNSLRDDLTGMNS